MSSHHQHDFNTRRGRHWQSTRERDLKQHADQVRQLSEQKKEPTHWLTWAVVSCLGVTMICWGVATSYNKGYKEGQRLTMLECGVEAVKRGHAKWVIDLDGNGRLVWNEAPKKSGMYKISND